MDVVKNLKPERVFYYFGEICKIPHGSFNTKQLSDYLYSFAKDSGLWAYQDEANNVLIRKGGSKGREDEPTVILQGHMDMVCVKTAESKHDFLTEPLDIYVEDGFLKARGTSLGGDDGIALAMALAILEDDTISHPPLEALFTTEEEVNMAGAATFDMGQLTGNRLINIDSEEEGFLTVGCAGGFRFDTAIPLDREEIEGILMEICIGGLTGGHSGVEIQKQRGNANVLMGRILLSAARQMSLRLHSVDGGRQDNVISQQCRAVISVTSSNVSVFNKNCDPILFLF